MQDDRDILPPEALDGDGEWDLEWDDGWVWTYRNPSGYACIVFMPEPRDFRPTFADLRAHLSRGE